MKQLIEYRPRDTRSLGSGLEKVSLARCASMRKSIVVIGSASRCPITLPGARPYQIADLGYWRPGGNFVIFYRYDGLTIPSPGIVLLGKVASNIDVFDISIRMRRGFDTVGIQVRSSDLSPQILGACDRIFHP
jgi:hypothetical protein